MRVFRALAGLVFALAMAGAARPEEPVFDAGFFDAPANPLDVTAQGDEGRKARRLIGPQGGVIETVGSDGTAYQLTVPPGALDAAVEISLLPALQMEGPLGRGEGVLLEPDGLVFRLPAQLTISRDGLSLGQNAGVWQGIGVGEDMMQAYFEYSPGRVTIPVFHFTIWRIDAEAAERDAIRQRNAARRAASWANRMLREIKEDAANKAAAEKKLNDLLKAYLGYLAKANKDVTSNPDLACKTLRQGISSFREMYALAWPAGAPKPGWLPYQAEIGSVLQDTMRGRCRMEAERQCALLLDANVITEQVLAESVLQSSAIDEMQNWETAAKKKCMTLTVYIESHQKGVYTDKDPGCQTPSSYDIGAKFQAAPGKGPEATPGFAGSGMANAESFKATLACGLDTGSIASVKGVKPVVVKLSPEKGGALRVEMDPGRMQTNWVIDGQIFSDTEYWYDAFEAAFLDRKSPAGFTFVLPPAGGKLSRTATFTGSGKYIYYGTYVGTETLTISVTHGSE